VTEGLDVPEFGSVEEFSEWWQRPEVQKILREGGREAFELLRHPNVRKWFDEYARTVDMSRKTAEDISERAETISKKGFGRYKVVDKIAEGGFGIVYRAYDPQLDRIVALKLLKLRTEDEIEHFQKEARLSAKLRHPNIISVHELGVLDGRPYYTMDFIEGESLGDKFARGERLQMEEAFRIACSVADALDYAHSQGIIHRDVKPDNVFIDEAGRVYVGDFGIAKEVRLEGRKATTSRIVGTPHYMSPEQANGEVLDARTDVWALGAMLYEMVCGVPPFQGDTAIEVFKKIWYKEPTPPRRLNPKLDRDAETIILKCLEKDADKRYPSASALKEDIERYMKGEAIKARPVGYVGRFLRRVRRNRAIAISISLLAVLSVVGMLFWSQVVEMSARRQAEKILSATAVAATPDKRLRIAEDAIRVCPEYIPAWVQKGEALRSLNRYDEAVSVFKEVVRMAHATGQTEAEATGNYFIGMILYQTGKREEAMPFLEKVIELLPGADNAVLRLTRAMDSLFKGDYDGAIEWANKALEMDERLADAYTIRGTAFDAKGEFDTAISDFDRAIGLNPEDATAYANRGATYIHKGEFDKAIEDFNSAIRLKPNMAGFYNNRGEAYRRKGDLDKALKDYNHAIELQPDLKEAYNNRGHVFLLQKDYDRAIEEFNRALEIAPDYASAYYNRAVVYHEKRDYDSAIRDYTKAIELCPDDALQYISRGMVFYAKDMPRKAMEDYRKAVTMKPSLWQGWWKIAHLAAEMRDRENCLEALSEAMRLNPDFIKKWVKKKEAFDWLRQDIDFKQIMGD